MWDEELKGIIGYVVAVDGKYEQSRTAFAIPISAVFYTLQEAVLKSEYRQWIVPVIAAFSKWDTLPADALLMNLTDDPDIKTRLAAIKALGRAGIANADIIDKLLCAGLHDEESGRTRKRWHRSGSSNEYGIYTWKKKPDWQTREWAIWAIGNLASVEKNRPLLQEHAFSELVLILNNPRNSQRLRKRATWALGELRDERGLSYLDKYTSRRRSGNPQDFELRRVAARSKERIREGASRK